MGENLVGNIVGSLKSGAMMLLLVIPAYILILGGFYYLRNRDKKAKKRISGAEADAVTGDWFGQKYASNSVAGADWPAGWKACGGVMLPDADGAYHAVDAMIRTHDGIFLVNREEKHGMITGMPELPEWIEHGKKGEFPFPNPLPRGDRALAALEALVQDYADNTEHELPEEVDTRSLVLFPDDAALPQDEKGRLMRQGEFNHMMIAAQSVGAGPPHETFMDGLWSYLLDKTVVTTPDLDSSMLRTASSGMVPSSGGGGHGLGPGAMIGMWPLLTAIVLLFILLFALSALGVL